MRINQTLWDPLQWNRWKLQWLQTKLSSFVQRVHQEHGSFISYARDVFVPNYTLKAAGNTKLTPFQESDLIFNQIMAESIAGPQQITDQITMPVNFTMKNQTMNQSSADKEQEAIASMLLSIGSQALAELGSSNEAKKTGKRKINVVDTSTKYINDKTEMGSDEEDTPTRTLRQRPSKVDEIIDTTCSQKPTRKEKQMSPELEMGLILKGKGCTFPACGQVFTRKGALKDHYHNAHPGMPPLL